MGSSEKTSTWPRFGIKRVTFVDFRTMLYHLSCKVKLGMINYLLTESEVFTVKYQNKVEVWYFTATVEVSNWFIIWHFLLRKWIQPELFFHTGICISACFNFVKMPTTATSVALRSFFRIIKLSECSSPLISVFCLVLRQRNFFLNTFFRIVSSFLFTGH